MSSRGPLRTGRRLLASSLADEAAAGRAPCENRGVDLPQPIGKQKEVVALAPGGHTVVLGTAGSGKTVMAIHRAAFLANEHTEHGGRTLLVTFNKTLVIYLDHLRPAELQNVEVRNYHRFARGYLRGRGLMPYGAICTPEQKAMIVREAIAEVESQQGRHALLDRPVEFFSSEIQWMAHHGITEKDDYIVRERIGRAQARLARSDRPLMFDVRSAYLRRRAGEHGKLYDWDDLATAAKNELVRDDSERYYKHVVVDEGQDFSPEMLRSLAAAIPADGSMTVFGDVAQQIYGRRLSWSDAGLAVTTPWIFERNYRNSPEIAALGLAIAEMPYYSGEPDMVLPTEFAARGPMPTLVRFGSRASENAFVIEQARLAGESGTVAILVRRRSDVGVFHSAFKKEQLLYRDMDAWNPQPGVSFGTIHASKGLEFDTVIVTGLSSDLLPDPQAVAAEGEAEATAGDGRLLYVAVTRARQSLILTCVGELSLLLPGNDGLWREESR